MSDYNRSYDRDDRSPPRRYQSSRTRPRDDSDPDYMEERTYVERGKGRPPRDLVPRSRDRDRDRDRDDSVESIRRDFPPPGSRRSRRNDDDDYDNGPRRTRSAATRRDRDRDRYSDEYSDDGYGPAAAGGAAGYAAGRSRGGRSSRRDRNGYHSEDDDRSPRRDERRKSGIEGAIEGLGLGGLLGALTGGKDKDKDDRDQSRSRSRSRARRGGDDRYDDRDRSRSRGPPSKDKKGRQWAQAAQAALVAGAIEAFKSRKEPGSWTGDKGKRIATAAISAGGIDKMVDKDPDRKSHRHLFEAVVGGLAANRLANGPAAKDGRGRSVSPGSRERSRSRSKSILDRFRSRSRGRGGSPDDDRDRGRDGDKKHDLIRDLVAGGALAATGKKIYDSVRSKSGRRRSPSAGSRDSYEPPSRSRRRRDVGPDNPRSRSMPPPDHNAVVGPRSQAGPLAAGGAAGGAAGALSGGHKANEDDSDSASSTDIENQRKRMTRKEMITAGLALVATIHAAHGVYNGIEASQKRHTLVQEGKMSVEEARKKKSKALLQDAAAVGIAALGIKGAYSEWKEMNEKRHSVQELEDKRRRRQKRRAARLKEQRLQQMHANGPMAPYMSGAAGDYYGGGPQGSLPPPPMGGSDRR